MDNFNAWQAANGHPVTVLDEDGDEVLVPGTGRPADEPGDR